MKPQTFWKVYFSVILLSVFVIVFSSVVFLKSAKEDSQTLDNLISFVVTILSVLIALLAYHISLKTYVSIDAVNAISRMDGNVMENEHYRTNILSTIRRFNAVDKKDACNQLLGYLENLFAKDSINSGARLADCIQEMIDVEVLFSFVIDRKLAIDSSPERHRIVNLIHTVERRVADFESLSEGSCVLIRESVKLLKAVYHIQNKESGHLDSEYDVTILDVRGTMLKNAISLTIYYNYMGLFFLKKAIDIVNEILFKAGRMECDALSINSVRVLDNIPDSSGKELPILYLEEALRNFENAVEPIRDELMWNAFIQYNIARTQYLLSILDKRGDYDWDASLVLAIGYREKLIMLLNDVLGKESKTFFQRAFEDQLKMARLMQIRFRLALGIEDRNKVELPEIGSDEFNRLTGIYKDIFNHIHR